MNVREGQFRRDEEYHAYCPVNSYCNYWIVVACVPYSLIPPQCRTIYKEMPWDSSGRPVQSNSALASDNWQLTEIPIVPQGCDSRLLTDHHRVDWNVAHLKCRKYRLSWSGWGHLRWPAGRKWRSLWQRRKISTKTFLSISEWTDSYCLLDRAVVAQLARLFHPIYNEIPVVHENLVTIAIAHKDPLRPCRRALYFTTPTFLLREKADWFAIATVVRRIPKKRAKAIDAKQLGLQRLWLCN